MWVDEPRRLTNRISHLGYCALDSQNFDKLRPQWACVFGRCVLKSRMDLSNRKKAKMRHRTPSTRTVGMKRHAMTLSTVDFRMPIDQYPTETQTTNSFDRPQNEVIQTEKNPTPTNQQDTDS